MRVNSPSNPLANDTSSSSSSSPNGLNATGQSAFAKVLAQLNTFVDGTPAEQMRAEILAQLGYTEDQLKAMSPADRAAAERKIAELEKQEVQTQTQKQLAKSGSDLAI